MNPNQQSAYDEVRETIERCHLGGENSTILDLSERGLTELPPAIGQLTGLTALYLEGNQLTTLPSTIRQLTALKLLNLSRNLLGSLPSEVGHLTALRRLYVDGNELTAVPPQIGQLTGLTTLNLSRNRLSALPTEIGQLAALQCLILEENALLMLPSNLQALTNLRELTLHKNEELELPPDLLGPVYALSSASNPPANPRAILDFYFARLTQGVAPMREVRVLLVGRGRVGKTSLLNVLRGVAANPLEVETPGIIVVPLELQCMQGTATGHGWDFGGQEFLHGTHQIFLSERCVYLLVLEGRDSNWEAETDYWLRFIQSYGGDSPVLIALNKYDEHKFSVDRFRLQERCPQIVGFVETDVFSGRGIVSLRAMLEETVNAMADVWLGVPKRWHQIKEALTQMGESFLDYKAYQGLCSQLGVADERQQETLAETLHRLGIALNFRDHHRLRETSVLKPQWVTEGIYGLLRFAHAMDCHGVLQRGWLDHALSAKDYPAEKHAFVLELMEKFEVAFALDSPKEKSKELTAWLIPELLPEVQPAPFVEFRAPGVRRLRFSYPEALPPGLLPRLIVRTHEMSSAHPGWRWRSGVVLRWGGAMALVRLNRSERRTEVAVIGSSQDDRQTLCDIIRAHLVVLHGKVQVLEEVEVIEEEEQEWIKMKELRIAERDKDDFIKVVVGKGAEERRITLRVVSTLDTVESVEARKAEGPTAPLRLRLFVSYAHADERKLKSALSTHLTILGQRGYIQSWDDKQLVAGESWKDRILKEMAEADIVLLIYSSEARASQFIQETEAPLAVELCSKDKCLLIVVPLDRNDWNDELPLERELRKLQAATWNATPVMDFRPHSKGWLEVEHAIKKAVEARRKVMDG